VTGHRAGDAFIPLADATATAAQLRDSARLVFDEIAELYDTARPAYPQALFDDLVTEHHLDRTADVLEIGCGTGQATGDLATLAGTVRCLEPGTRLAALARGKLARFPNVTIAASTFEAADVEANSYDVVFSATAFHWVDATIGYAKAATALRPGGWLILATNAHAHGGTQHQIDAAVNDLHRRLTPELGEWTFPTEQQIAERIEHAGADIAHVWAAVDRCFTAPPDTSADFEPVIVRRYPWIADYDCDGYLAMLASQSSYRRLPRREELLAAVGALIDQRLDGRISKSYVTVLAAARRRGRSATTFSAAG